jgi:Na+/melibiose symporter-like transporter
VSRVREQVDDAIVVEGSTELRHARRVLANPRFLALFGSQILTQVGGNMVLFGLTVTVFGLTDSSTSVSVLLLTFLVPAVVFGAIAGVFVDMFDRRTILITTNLARAGLYMLLVFLSDQLALIYIVTAIVATLTTFFAPAEAAMIPLVVKRDQLMSANSLFILALQASFVLGFAVLGPLAQTVFGTDPLILIVAGAYGLAGLLCWVLPSAPPSSAGQASLASARSAVNATFEQLREGLAYIRDNRNVFWSLTYLTMVSSLIGVLGVLGPDFAKSVLGLEEGDLVVVLLPLGAGLLSGIIVLNLVGRYLPRRRLIEGGLLALAGALTILGLAQDVGTLRDGGDTTALLSVVVVVAFAAGVCYAFVAVPAQTSLQEELPSDVRGRVFGVLNMLVSLASFVPIIIVGPLADVLGAAAVIVTSALIVGVVGLLSIGFARPRVTGSAQPINIEAVDPMTVTTVSSTLNRPIRLRYIPDDADGDGPIRMMASAVVPGRAGPARTDGPQPEPAEARKPGPAEAWSPEPAEARPPEPAEARPPEPVEARPPERPRAS